MQWYTYTIIDVHSHGHQEYHGLLRANSVEQVIMDMSQRGYIVRDVRTATDQDIRLEVLRRYERQLRGQLTPDTLPKAGWLRDARRWKRSFPWRIAFVALVIILIITFLILENT